MINSILYTIKKQDYSSLRGLLNGAGIPEDALAALKQIIEEHKTITDLVEKEIRRQLREAVGMFPGVPLFDAPPQGEKGDDKKNATGSSESEKTENTPDSAAPKNDEELAERAERKSKKEVTRIKHALDRQNIKCPGCQKNMHLAHEKSVTIIRLAGLVEEKHEIETCRCLECGTSKEAEFAEANEKRIGNFTVDAASMICSLRYALGMPSFRLEEFTACMGLRIADSTQWDLFERCADEVHDFMKFLRQHASKGEVIQMDDTSVRINEMAQMFKSMKNGDLQPVARTGLHTTGYLAKFAQGKICLFDSGLHHAGEVFEKMNKARSVEEQVILMTDASSSNTCKVGGMSLKVIQANCNSHAVRKFKELDDSPAFEEHVTFILKLYRSIFELDKQSKEKSPMERLILHQKQSLPKMLEIKSKIEEDFVEKRVEPNSPLGSAYKYFLNHFEKLIAFCKYERAPICNNESERLLKRAIRHRKNSLFFKNRVGAAVGDIHMSILLTAKENGLNPVHYLAALLKFGNECRQNPEAFLPWNFSATLEQLKTQSAPTAKL